MIEFCKTKAIDFCDDVRDGTHDSPKHLDSGYLLITSKNIKSDKIDFENASYISKEDYEKINERSLVEINDILYSMIGTVGIVYRVKEKPNYAIKNMGLFKIKDELKSKWLYYYLQTSEAVNEVNSKLSGSTQKFISLSNLRGLNIKYPVEKNNMNKIVKILDTIESKINNNNDTNRLLEEVSQTIFDNYISNSKDLNVCKIKDLKYKLETGKRPPGGVNLINGGIPSIGAESIKGIGYFDFSKTKYVTSDFYENMKKGIIKGYELLIYKDGGKPGYFIPNFSIFGEGFPYDECSINEHVFLLDFYNKQYNIFAYYFFNSDSIKHKLHVLGSKSAAIPGINQQDIINIEIPNPADCESNILDVLEINTRKILINCKENYLLENIKKSFLSKLMSGEIDLDNIEI